MIILDCEIFPNYFLASFLDTDSDKIVRVSRFGDEQTDLSMIEKIMKRYTTMGFNSAEFDLPLLTYALTGATIAQLKAFSNALIESGKSWQVLKKHKLFVPKQWDHIDLIEVAPGQSSLKIYAGRLGFHRMQDLPYPHDKVLTREEADKVADYCDNDLRATATLYKALQKDITLRESMSEQYGVDLRSKSDAQIAETVIISELSKKTGRDYARPELSRNYSFKYKAPPFIQFSTPILQSVYEKVLAHSFTLADSGSVELPDWLTEPVCFDGQEYRMGIGGLHSSEKKRTVVRKEGEVLLDLDVASYYPNIILGQKLYPKHLGPDFLEVYASIVRRRLAAKKLVSELKALPNRTAEQQDEMELANRQQAGLKLSINGSFGKLGSKYSKLYSPDLLIQVTLSGQLALLMLIERLHLSGISVISANTDGVVVHTAKENEQRVEQVAFEWMIDTTYELERADYLCLASRDVNNYLAVKLNRSAKGKGIFGEPSLAKNPDGRIIYEAVSAFVVNRTPLAETIQNCRDIGKFVTVRTVKGGAEFRGKPVGKAIRFYHSTSVPITECIRYITNGNKVPNTDGCIPHLDFGDFPTDIDYQHYITEAEKTVALLGWKNA